MTTRIIAAPLVVTTAPELTRMAPLVVAVSAEFPVKDEAPLKVRPDVELVKVMTKLFA